jgi:ribosome-interacting GTPase 1
MMDLANMLEYSSIGANISSKLINCLLFADDVVLIAESPEELQELLNISNAFANKWNLKFNPKKSKILITGKKINNITLFSTFSYIFLSSLQCLELN